MTEPSAPNDEPMYLDTPAPGSQEPSALGPRILLSGLPSTGKTTLASLLAAALGLPVAAEAATDLIEAGLAIGPATDWPTMCSIAILQHSREPSTGGFVADRGAIDLATFAGIRAATAAQPHELLLSDAILRFAQEWLVAARYDLVLLHLDPIGIRSADLLEDEGSHLDELRSTFRRVTDASGIASLTIRAGDSVEHRAEQVLAVLHSRGLSG